MNMPTGQKRHALRVRVAVLVSLVAIFLAVSIILYLSQNRIQDAGFVSSVTNETRSIASFVNIGADQAHKLMTQGYFSLIIDVRTREEYRTGRINGSINIPLDELERRITEIIAYRDQPILVYCRTGRRSEYASSVLVNHGFTRVYNLQGGLTSWLSRGYQVVR